MKKEINSIELFTKEKVKEEKMKIKHILDEYVDKVIKEFSIKFNELILKEIRINEKEQEKTKIIFIKINLEEKVKKYNVRDLYKEIIYNIENLKEKSDLIKEIKVKNNYLEQSNVVDNKLHMNELEIELNIEIKIIL